jgi:hypothetical protein
LAPLAASTRNRDRERDVGTKVMARRRRAALIGVNFPKSQSEKSGAEEA